MEDYVFPPPYVVGMVIFSAFVGALCYAFIRPNNDSLPRKVAGIAAGTGLGSILPFGICEYMEWKPWSILLIVALVIGLLGITVCRALVSLMEKDGMAMVTNAIKRLFGINGGGDGPRRPSGFRFPEDSDEFGDKQQPAEKK